MIWESSFWKADLLRRARELRRRGHQRRWQDASLARLEQLTMMGFYGVRKLLEAKKLSLSVASHTVRLHAYPPTGKPVTLRNWHKLDLLYRFQERQLVSLGLRELCHQFVHSYVFCPWFGRVMNLRGFLLASDRQRCKALLEVTAHEVVRIFELVGRDYVVHERWEFNSKVNDYDVTAWSAGDMPHNNEMQLTSGARWRPSGAPS